MMKDKTYDRKLYELVRVFDRHIEIPDAIRFPKVGDKWSDNLKGIVHSINQFNDSADIKDQNKNLKNLCVDLLRLMDEMLLDVDRGRSNTANVIRKKDYVIKGLKDFIASQSDLDAEIPSKDDEDEKDVPKNSSLSKKELELIKKFK